MGRKPRCHIPGCFYHVIARGNSRQPIFFETGDYCRFLALLDEAQRKHGHRVHAYCLMTNHVHLLLQMQDVPVSALAHCLLSRYARWLNRRLDRTGHLFERRHRSILLRSDDQLLEVLRYIHRNPVRAGLSRSCSRYRWSSHGVYAGQRGDLDVTTGACLRTLDADPRLARDRYFALMGREDDCREHRPDLCDRCQGLDAAETEIRRPARTPTMQGNPCPSPQAVLAAAAASAGCTVSELVGSSMARRHTRARAAAALYVADHQRLTLSGLARVLDRDLSTVSEAAERCRRRIDSDPRYRQVLAGIYDALAL